MAEHRHMAWPGALCGPAGPSWRPSLAEAKTSSLEPLFLLSLLSLLEPGVLEARHPAGPWLSQAHLRASILLSAK